MPAAPPSAPPAAPAAKPSSAPAPIPKHDPIQPPPEKDQSDWMAAEAEELDSLDPDVPKKAKKAEKPPEKIEPKPEDKKPEDDEPIPGEEEQKPPEKPAEPEKPVKAADLRKAYEESQRKIREELSPKVAKLESRIRELETAKPAELEPLQAKLTTLEKRNAELEQQVEFLDYQKSPKFQKEYWEPYVAKYNEALNELRQVEVEQADGTLRRGTEDDLLELWNLESGALRKRANALFGDSADDIVPIIKEVQRLGRAQSKALADAEKNTQERINARKAEAITDQTERANRWNEANKNLAEKYPTYFKTKEGDVEGNKRFAAGEALTALLFNVKPLTDEEIKLLPTSFQADIQAHGKLKPENIVRMHALIKNKAANHDRLAFWLKQTRAELKEAKAALKEYEQSEPPGGGGGPSGGGGGGGRWSDDADAELDRLDRQGR